MQSVIITGSKNIVPGKLNKKIQFTAGEIFLTQFTYTRDGYLLQVKEMTDSQVVRETLLSKKIHRITTTQNSVAARMKDVEFHHDVIQRVFAKRFGYGLTL